MSRWKSAPIEPVAGVPGNLPGEELHQPSSDSPFPTLVQLMPEGYTLSAWAQNIPRNSFTCQPVNGVGCMFIVKRFTTKDLPPGCEAEVLHANIALRPSDIGDLASPSVNQSGLWNDGGGIVIGQSLPFAERTWNILSRADGGAFPGFSDGTDLLADSNPIQPGQRTLPPTLRFAHYEQFPPGTLNPIFESPFVIRYVPPEKRVTVPFAPAPLYLTETKSVDIGYVINSKYCAAIPPTDPSDPSVDAANALRIAGYFRTHFHVELHCMLTRGQTKFRKDDQRPRVKK